MKKVSVWMITYNQEEYIAEAIESVLMQKTDFDFEIVIGEDCSTDETKNILLDYQKKYPDKIKLLLHKKNIGMVANQNKTFDACSGEYIAMLEGDDYWSSRDKLQKQYDTLQNNHAYDLCFHPVYSTEKNILNFYGKNERHFSVDEVIEGGGFFISTPSVMIRKDIIDKIPSFLEDAPAGDYYIQIFGSLRGGALYIPDIMATYRIKAKGSWSESLSDFEVKSSFTEKSLSISKKLDSYFDKKYTLSFQKRYLTLSLFLAMDYLYYNQVEKFSYTMQNISSYVKEKNLKFKIFSLFVRYPKILLWISKILNKLKIK